MFDDLLELVAVASDPSCTVAGSLGNFIWNITRSARPIVERLHTGFRRPSWRAA
jgi:hypothetical protein